MKKNYNHINLSYLELMSDGDVEMKKVMLEMLFEEPVQEFEKMAQAVKEEDWQTLKAVSHKMKSTLAFVGNDLLTTTNKKVESIVKEMSDVAQLPDLIKLLQDNYQKALVELKTEYATS